MIIVTIISVLISGCCYFAPCHRGTDIIGKVKDEMGNPINKATVSLFGISKSVGENGCFTFRAADAIPFTITADALGYKPYSGDVKYGKYRVVIILHPVDSKFESRITWTEINDSEFESERKGCP